MLKYIALLFNSVALLIYQLFFADVITVTQKMPSSVKAESEFTVELTINKGTTGGFAKLQQDLPEGFTAEKIESNGGTFTFSNQSVKLIWMSLPAEKEFKVSYKVKLAAGVTGDKTIGGKFSYVVDNVKQSIDITPATVKVEGETPPVVSTPIVPQAVTETVTANVPPPATELVTTTTTTTTTTATTETTTNKTPEPTPAVVTAPPANITVPAATGTTTGTGTTEPSSITCVRSILNNSGNEFMVEINVNKGNVSGFAKLIESLPVGLTATAVESQSASFTFADQKVKFVWVSMPSKPVFKISYKITADQSVKTPQVIDGVFSFIENDETKKFILPSSTIDIGGTGTPPPVATNTPPVTSPAATTTITPVATETTTPVATATTTTVATATTTPVAAATPAITPAEPVTTSATSASEKPLSATTIPSPQGNLNYSVQIMALRRAVEASALAARYNINENVKTEMAEGFTKYTVGSHNEYKTARDAREEIKNKGVVGPFVTAYNSGKRITVQEALMISNQKWYK